MTKARDTITGSCTKKIKETWKLDWQQGYQLVAGPRIFWMPIVWATVAFIAANLSSTGLSTIGRCSEISLLLLDSAALLDHAIVLIIFLFLSVIPVQNPVVVVTTYYICALLLLIWSIIGSLKTDADCPMLTVVLILNWMLFLLMFALCAFWTWRAKSKMSTAAATHPEIAI